MRIKDGFVLRDVLGDNVIIAEGLEASVDFGRLLCLNETAAWLWEEAVRQSDFTISSLVKALCDEYNVSEEKAQTDVTAIVEKWLEKKLIEDYNL